MQEENVKLKHAYPLKRLDHQLSITESVLSKHPLTQDKLAVVQTALHFLSLQTRWSSAGPLARYLISSQAALFGQQTEKSMTGFIGPTLHQLQMAIGKLITAILPPEMESSNNLLITTVELTSLATIYATTQILGEWREMFPFGDPAGAQKAGELFQELGLAFILGSHTIENFFQMITEGLNIPHEQQKLIGDLGLFYILTLLMISIGDSSSNRREELLESLQGFIPTPLNSIEKVLQKAQRENLLDDEVVIMALSYVQLMRQTLEDRNTEAVPQVIQEALQAFELPYQGVKDDLKKAIQFCTELNEIFYHIFYKTEKTMTTMHQAA